MKAPFFNLKAFLVPLFCLKMAAIFAQNAPLDSLSIAKIETLEQLKADSIRQTRAQIRVISRHQNGSVLLRWAPDRAGAWAWGHRVGWHVERGELILDGEKDVPIRFERLTQEPLRLAPETEWAQTPDLEGRNRFAAAAAGCIFGQKKGIETGNIFAEAEDFETRFGFSMLAADLSVEAARLQGLRFVDRKIEAGKTYVYKLFAAAPTADYPIDTAYLFLNTDRETDLFQPILEKIECLDGQISLFWSREASAGQCSAFWIERADDGSTAWRRLNQQPYLQMLSTSVEADERFFSFADTTISNYKKYSYRIVGITPFGDETAASPAVEAASADRTPPPAPGRVAAKHLDGTRMEISWQMPDGENLSEVAGFFIGRSDRQDFQAKAIHEKPLPSSARSWIDEKADPFAPNYYVVAAVDTAGNPAFSLITLGAIVDTFAPAPPTGLRARADTTGRVTVSWQKSPEKDLKGYLLFFANAADHAFGPMQNAFIQDTFFVDSMSLWTLTEERFFRLKAIDRSENYSTLSDTARLILPDIVPPAPPIFLDYEVSKKGVFLKWVCSQSLDVEGHILLRKGENEAKWTEIQQFSGSKTDSWIDSTATVGGFFDYSIIAFDDAGLRSEMSKPLRLKRVDFSAKPTVESLAARLDLEKKQAVLTWKKAAARVQKLVVYRSENAGAFRTVKTLAADQTEWADQFLEKGKAYEYSVKAIFEDGRSSAFSSTARIEF